MVLQALYNYILNLKKTTMKKLTEVANKLGTDKGTDSFCGHSYTLTYEELFDSLVDQHVKMLEIGVADPRFPGASVKMWKEYFPSLTFVGYDINSEALKFAQEGVSIFIGDQNNPVDLQRCIAEHGNAGPPCIAAGKATLGTGTRNAGE